MVTDDSQHPNWFQALAEAGERTFEPSEFIIYGNPEGLKQASEVSRAASSPEDGTNGVHEVVTPAEGCILAAPQHFASEPVCAPFVSVVPEYLPEIGFFRRVEQICSRLSDRFHTHVECCARTEGETPGLGVQLTAGHSQIQQNELRAELAHCTERFPGTVFGLEIGDSFIAQPAARPRHGFRIAVNPKDF